MCGRFTLRTPMGLLVEQFRLENSVQMSLRFNVAPTQQVVAVRSLDESPRHADLLRWGLVPSWAKELSIGSRMINARCETVAEKPAFRSAFKKRRCLVLADGYIEWKKVGSKKQPYHIHMSDDRPFAFAGLWERWSKGESPVETCTVITTDANELTRDVHDRMPVILDESHYDLWLDPEFQDRDTLCEMLSSYPSNEMAMDAVSMRVNKVQNDDPECLEVQQQLFD